MKKRQVTSTVMVAVAAIIAVGSVAYATDTPAPTAIAAKDASFDGKDVFVGLYFGQGHIGKKLVGSGLFAGLPAGQLARNNTADGLKVGSEIVRAIETESPGFFAGFSSNARSGDPRRVERAISDGASLLKRQGARFEKNSQQGAWITTKAIAHSWVVAANAVYAVNVATAVNVVTLAVVVFGLRDQPGGTTPLRHDQMVAKLTKLLRNT